MQFFPPEKLLSVSGNITFYHSVIFKSHKQCKRKRSICHDSSTKLQSHSGASSTCADHLQAINLATVLEMGHTFLSVAATVVVKMKTSLEGDVGESLYKSQDLVLLLHIISD